MIWGIGTTFVLFQFLLQLSSGVLVERLMQEFSMTALSAGLMSGAYYYIYVALQTPAGMLIDRYGARRLLSLGGLVCALGCGLFAMTEQVWMADLGRLLMGGGSAFAFVGTLYLISNWFPAAYFGMMLGFSDLIATIATIGANIYLATLLEKVSWRTSMGAAGLLAVAIGLLSWIIIRDRPAEAAPVAKQSTKEFGRHVLWVFRNPKLWLNGVFNGVVFSIVGVFSGMWGIPFIAAIHTIGTAHATIVASMLFVGLAVGCPVIGLLYPRVRPHLRVIFVSMALALSLLLSWLIYLPPTSLIAYSAIMIVMGMICSVYVLSFTYVKELVPVNVQTTAIGFTNALCVATIPIFQPLVGYLLHLAAQWRISPGEPEIYTVADYQWALSVLPIALVIAAGLALFIFDKKSEPKDATQAIGVSG